MSFFPLHFYLKIKKYYTPEVEIQKKIPWTFEKEFYLKKKHHSSNEKRLCKIKIKSECPTETL
jgi:hypothetical protein